MILMRFSVYKLDQPVLKLMEMYDINTRAKVCDFNFAENYRERSKLVDIKTTSISIYVLSIEDLVIAKLNASREKDLKDIKHKDVIKKIDWTLLETLKDNVLPNLLNDRLRDEFLYAYQDYVRSCKK